MITVDNENKININEVSFSVNYPIYFLFAFCKHPVLKVNATVAKPDTAIMLQNA